MGVDISRGITVLLIKIGNDHLIPSKMCKMLIDFISQIKRNMTKNLAFNNFDKRFTTGVRNASGALTSSCRVRRGHDLHDIQGSRPNKPQLAPSLALYM